MARCDDFEHLIGQNENWQEFVGKVNWEGPKMIHVRWAACWFGHEIKI